MTRYTLGTGYKIARNHAICNGPFIVAVVPGAGYPIGEGWAPETEAKAQRICDLLNADETKQLPRLQQEAIDAMAAALRIAQNYMANVVPQPRRPEERNAHAAAVVGLRLAEEAGLIKPC